MTTEPTSVLVIKINHHCDAVGWSQYEKRHAYGEAVKVYYKWCQGEGV